MEFRYYEISRFQATRRDKIVELISEVSAELSLWKAGWQGVVREFNFIRFTANLSRHLLAKTVLLMSNFILRGRFHVFADNMCDHNSSLSVCDSVVTFAMEAASVL
jgi:hypothetical protein